MSDDRRADTTPPVRSNDWVRKWCSMCDCWTDHDEKRHLGKEAVTLESNDVKRWDAIAAEMGYPPDWREVGWDTPETMLKVYERTPRGLMLCPWPKCSFARRDEEIEAMFRHVHGAHRG